MRQVAVLYPSRNSMGKFQTVFTRVMRNTGSQLNGDGYDDRKPKALALLRFLEVLKAGQMIAGRIGIVGLRRVDFSDGVDIPLG